MTRGMPQHKNFKSSASGRKSNSQKKLSVQERDLRKGHPSAIRKGRKTKAVGLEKWNKEID